MHVAATRLKWPEQPHDCCHVQLSGLVFYVRADTPNGALPLISTMAEIGVTRKGNQAQQVIL